MQRPVARPAELPATVGTGPHLSVPSTRHTELRS